MPSSGYILVFLSALGLGLILIGLLRRFALKANLVTAEGVSYLGGPGIWLAFSLVCIAALWLYGLATKTAWGIVLSSSLIVVFGLIDDYKKELTVSGKFLVQLIATILLILFGIRTRIIYIGLYGNLLVTFFWVLGITNAFNHLDILDGLAGGIAAISAAAFFLIAFSGGNISVAIYSLALIAVTLGFLRYNLSSAKVYMGNSGSHFLGFTLAAIAITISYAPLERKIALLSPILVLGLSIFDTSLLMFIRARKGRSVFKKSDDHFALKLLTQGYSHKQVLISMYLLGLFFSLSGVIINRVSNQTGIVILSVVILAGLIVGRKISRISMKLK